MGLGRCCGFGWEGAKKINDASMLASSWNIILELGRAFTGLSARKVASATALVWTADIKPCWAFRTATGRA